MIRRIFRSLITLVALIVAYQAYLLLAVPWLDPPLVTRSNATRAKADRKDVNPVTKYQRLLAHYFPAGHWSLVRPPIVIVVSNGSGMLVLDDYDQDDNGRVEIKRCVALGFPTPLTDGVVPPHDAVIVEAPQGAKLQFDEGFRLERGEIGQILRGDFPGRITIRSGMRSPGPEDDLLVETSDLSMNTKILYTQSPVRFRMGPNVGGGRELEIRFLDDEHSARSKRGWKLDAFASLEVRRDVRARLHLATSSLLPGAEDNENDESEGPRIRRLPEATEVAITNANTGSFPTLKGKADEKPVEVTCTGPFYFDLVQYVASFDRNVEARQIHPEGPSDQLSAQKLDVHFLPAGESNVLAKRSAVEAARRQKDDLARLRPALLVAQGHPVVVVSPSRGAEARGEKIEMGLGDQSLRLSGGQEVRLTYGPNLLRAPRIEYQHPPKDSASTIGSFRAAGPGNLYYLLDATKPNQAFVATWQSSIETTRDDGQPVITLTGRPKLSLGTMGRLAADEIRVRLRENVKGGVKQPGLLLPGKDGKQGLDLDASLERVTAHGNVEIDSPEFVGRTQELVAAFHSPSHEKLSPYAVPSESPPSVGTAASPLELAGSGNSPRKTYYIESDEIRIEAAMHANRASPRHLACTGNVLLREIPPQRSTAAEPMEIRGGQLVARDLETSARITIRGAESAYSPETDAELRARGMTLQAPTVELDQDQNRLWIASSGNANLMVTRDLTGRAAAAPYPIEIRWQGGLNFDGRYIVFDRDIQVQGNDALLRCDRMTARLTAPIEFGTSANQETVDVEQIECQGSVVLDQRTRDESGPTSHQRLQLPRLVINQQTGVIGGEGPGIVRSTHFADQLTTLGAAGKLAQGRESLTRGRGNGLTQPAIPTVPRPRLHFLRIDFQRSLGGNLYTRELVFNDRVRTVYGPVDSWQQELDGRQWDVLPSDCVVMSCDVLSVSEDPIAARASASADHMIGQAFGPVQLRAEGNVRIDGHHSTNGLFGAQAERASYEQAKDTILIEGTPRTPAMFWQKRIGAVDVTPLEALQVRYNLATGEPDVDKARYIEFTPALTVPHNARGAGASRQ